MENNICPECGAVLSDGQTACPECGAVVADAQSARLEGSTALSDVQSVCPECGAVLHDAQSVCPECGYVLKREISLKKDRITAQLNNDRPILALWMDERKSRSFMFGDFVGIFTPFAAVLLLFSLVAFISVFVNWGLLPAIIVMGVIFFFVAFACNAKWCAQIFCAKWIRSQKIDIKAYYVRYYKKRNSGVLSFLPAYLSDNPLKHKRIVIEWLIYSLMWFATFLFIALTVYRFTKGNGIDLFIGVLFGVVTFVLFIGGFVVRAKFELKWEDEIDLWGKRILAGDDTIGRFEEAEKEKATAKKLIKYLYLVPLALAGILTIVSIVVYSVWSGAEDLDWLKQYANTLNSISDMVVWIGVFLTIGSIALVKDEVFFLYRLLIKKDGSALNTNADQQTEEEKRFHAIAQDEQKKYWLYLTVALPTVCTLFACLFACSSICGAIKNYCKEISLFFGEDMNFLAKALAAVWRAENTLEFPFFAVVVSIMILIGGLCGMKASKKKLYQ